MTTYIYGDTYQDYIPLLVYSLQKSYPSYSIILFINGILREDIDKVLHTNDLYNNLEIIENTFSDCPEMNPLKAMTLRWVLWSEKFNNFDYIYIVDIDMLYFKEPITLIEQHVKHLNILSLPFSNIKRPYKIPVLDLMFLARRFKYSGLKGVLKSIFKGGQIEYRASGLHFIKRKEYYAKLTPEKRNFYKSIIYNGDMFKYIINPDNEAFLYWMLNDIGFNPIKMGTQKSVLQMLDFDRFEQKDFRPHHGIHLGMFRTDILDDTNTKIMKSKPYIYYCSKYLEYANDSLFQKIVKESSEKVKLYISKLNSYLNENVE